MMLKNTRKNTLNPGAILLTGLAMRGLIDYYDNWRHARRSVEEFYPAEERNDISLALSRATESVFKNAAQL